ncbi:hypothetical protein PGT21_016285 [Puccinia graminis f. sp. tritici]|uniref:Uncharacterized protein n=1 Tax=Puccinia graminis f. sp. tritici TaxID=56615 RepID=A0A5B0R9R9_PUCGR|nr:hypothetical protein PGT21_015024 [Puccinia graminis f. sp. tritici]KAA1076698.1 hypothetical protein PGT21_016285 [Puccinia graminis f. sp. tritici]KAA1122132.1 hypothetical protein PGTUg99_029286 [Puccinia graminis f. sp. tritici]KAA1126861.1 hypothetical protein PGTUg99_028849 [Puccinia graminis f. sp. tritici]
MMKRALAIVEHLLSACQPASFKASSSGAQSVSVVQLNILSPIPPRVPAEIHDTLLRIQVFPGLVEGQYIHK